MISVFFRCNCPFEGYVEKKIDYVNKQYPYWIQGDMTYTGYSLFHSSGSYMVLANFEGRKYFHSRQTQSQAFDDQNRPVYTNVVFVGNSPQEDLVVSRLAGYALMKEPEFYQEIASMITLLDGDFAVDFDALERFLKRFERDYQVSSSNPADEKMCEEIFFKRTSNDIDFVVLQADLDFLNKQLGRLAKVRYAFERKDMHSLCDRVAVTFSAGEKEPLASEQLPVEAAAAEEKGTMAETAAAQEVPVREEKPAVAEKPFVPETPSVPKESTENWREALLNAAREELEEAKAKLASLTVQIENLKNALKKKFLLGLAAGIIGTVLAVLMIKLIF